MSRADLPVTTATSFAAIGAECDDDGLLADFLDDLDKTLTRLAHDDLDRVHREIEELCATVGREVTVSLPDGSTLKGRATRLDPEGRLVVEAGTIETVVSAGDVVHVR